MAILIIELQGRRQAGTLEGTGVDRTMARSRLVVIDDKAVSRIHAWIGLQCGWSLLHCRRRKPNGHVRERRALAGAAAI